MGQSFCLGCSEQVSSKLNYYFRKMKLLSVIVLLFGVVAISAIETEENVLILTDENFDSAVADNKYILVEFYAPWCGHCKALAPEFAKAATELEAEKSEIKLASLDATIHKNAAEKFGVRGYPTLKFFKSGEAKEYGGGRTHPDIVNWLKKKTGPPTRPCATEEEFAALKKDNAVAVVGYFADADSESAKHFTNVADSFDDVPFFVVSDEKVAAAAGLEADKVALFKEDYMSKLQDSTENLAFFIRGEFLPIMQELNPKTAPKIFGGEIQNHALLFVSKKSDDFTKHTEAFKTAAAEFKGQMLFIYIDSDQEENKRVMEFFGLTVADTPTYRVIKMSENMAKFKPEDDLSAEAVTKFAQGVLSGDVKRHLMSEEVAEGWNAQPVSVLVGKNFKEVAFDSSKKVFVEFYVPWCGHCKSLAPIWDKLGEKFASDDSVVIAKMDSTANEIEAFEIQGFPTSKFFPSGSDKVMDYNGDRTMEAMAEFVESNGEKVSEEAEEEFDEEQVAEDEDDELPEERGKKTDGKDEL